MDVLSRLHQTAPLSRLFLKRDPEQGKWSPCRASNQLLPFANLLYALFREGGADFS